MHTEAKYKHNWRRITSLRLEGSDNTTNSFQSRIKLKGNIVVCSLNFLTVLRVRILERFISIERNTSRAESNRLPRVYICLE